jgi:hypothetical protein
MHSLYQEKPTNNQIDKRNKTTKKLIQLNKYIMDRLIRKYIYIGIPEKRKKGTCSLFFFKRLET